MHTHRIPLRRRLAGVLVATLVVLTGGLMLASSANATFGQDVCPGTNFNPVFGGWVKYEPIGTLSYTYPQKAGFDVTDVCYKASNELRWPDVTGSVTSTVTNRWGHPQAISHVSVFYSRSVPPKPADHVTVEQLTAEPSCETPTVQAGTRTTTVSHWWNAFTWSWEHSAPVVTEDLHDVSLSAEALALCNAGPKPEPVVEVQQRTGEPSCEDPEVEVGTVTITTDWVLDIQTGTWVPGEPVEVPDLETLSLTEEELLACETGPEPEPVVERLAYTGEPTCAAPTVLVGEVITTTGWVLDTETNTWVPDEPIVDDQRVQVSLTAAELAACVPTQPTQPTQPTAPTAPLALAQTGSPALLPALTALGLALMGAAALVARRRLHA